ncbi:IucA/IucC family protein [Salinibius halmophilus]|uniref:IucA/IucC family protein n=1 Tax=Salinibius halmophilus TaxID=1853216 RepID=UPI000E6643A0|nr:IucA/IucC family protein [Salinibius halmophilus]
MSFAKPLEQQAMSRVLLNLAREQLITLDYCEDGAWMQHQQSKHWLAGTTKSALLEPNTSAVQWPKSLNSLSKLLESVNLQNSEIGQAIIDNYRVNQRVEAFRAQLPLLDWCTLWQDFGHSMTAHVEQLGADGHPSHPVERLKIGWSEQQEQAWSAEYNSQYQLPIYAIAKSHAQLAAPNAQYFRQCFAHVYLQWQNHLAEQGINPDEYMPLPVHPGQVEIANQAEGVIETTASITVRPGISQRSVYCTEQMTMVKVPMDVRTTSAMRHLSTRSCHVGPALSQWLKDYSGLQAHQNFCVLGEYDGMYHQDWQARLSVLYRQSPLEFCTANETAICTAAFLANRRGPSLAKQLLGDCLSKFKQYCELVITPALELFLQTGLALEAHQQNSLLRINQAGQVTGFMVRDFGAPRISQADTHHIDIDWQIAKSLVVADRATARAKLVHALLLCHIAELIEQLGDTQARWTIVKEVIRRTISNSQLEDDAKEAEIQGFCQQPWQVKALLSMWGKSDYQYCQISNPMEQL